MATSPHARHGRSTTSKASRLAAIVAGIAVVVLLAVGASASGALADGHREANGPRGGNGRHEGFSHGGSPHGGSPHGGSPHGGSPHEGGPHEGSPHEGFPGRDAFADHAVFDGLQLQHTTPGGSEPLTKPDDITFLDGHIFVAFQNGVGPQGGANSTGNLDSTVVELDPTGHPVNQWDIVGKCDGLTADPATGGVIATVNEDANSSLYTINPSSGEVVHYAYSEPLPSDGGTDAISIYHGTIMISASAPGTT
jgi:hypothetical protein